MRQAVWVQHGGEVSWALIVSEELAKLGVNVQFVSFLKNIHEMYLAEGRVSNYISEIFDDVYALDDEQIKSLELKYGPPSLDCLVASDEHLKMLYGESSKPKVQIFARALQYWENYFQQYNTHFVLLRDRASLSTRSAHQVAKKMGNIEVLTLDIGPDDKHFALHDVETQLTWSTLLEALKEENKFISQERRHEIDEFVKGRVPDNKMGDMHLNIPELTKAGRIANFFQKRKTERRLKKENPMELAVYRLVCHINEMRSNWKKNRKGFDYYSPSNDDAYIFFPLFFTSESVHLVNIRHWCRNVVELVHSIAESLPQNYLLYVKEHPIILGDLNRDKIDKIRSIDKVRVVHPSLQSQNLIRNSKAVITTEGSAGWEAFLLKKPVILVGGEPFYSYANQVRVVKDILDMESAVFEVLSGKFHSYENDLESWYKFIDCVLSTSYIGNLETYEYPHITDTTRENLKGVAKALDLRMNTTN